MKISLKTIEMYFSQALDTNIFDRFMILQGLDYPICSNLEIHDFFSKYSDKEFIRAVNETSAEDFKDIAKYRFNWYWDKHNRLPFLWNKMNMLFLKFKAPFFSKAPYLQLNGKAFEIYRGWAHFALTRIAVEYIIAFYYNNPSFNQRHAGPTRSAWSWKKRGGTSSGLNSPLLAAGRFINTPILQS